jgi:hypothetical protein
MTISDVVQCFGGTGSMAHVLGVNKSTVSCWVIRHSIPSRYWKRIETIGKRRRLKVDGEEITIEALEEANRSDA